MSPSPSLIKVLPSKLGLVVLQHRKTGHILQSGRNAGVFSLQGTLAGQYSNVQNKNTDSYTIAALSLVGIIFYPQ